MFVVRTARRRARAAPARWPPKPRRVLVIGGGFTGSEVASVCRELGLDVTARRARRRAAVGALGGVIGAIAADMQRDARRRPAHRRRGDALEGDARGRVQRRRALRRDRRSTSTSSWSRSAGCATSSGWRGSRPGGRRAGHRLRRRLPRLRRQRRSSPTTSSSPATSPASRTRSTATSSWRWSTGATRVIAGRGRRAQHDLRRGRPPAAHRVPGFWSIQFGVNIKSVGVPTIADEVVVTQGSIDDRRFVAAYGLNGTIVAAVSFNAGRYLEYLRAPDRGRGAVPARPQPRRPGHRRRPGAGRLPAARPS